MSTKSAYQFAQTRNSRAVCFHCVPASLNHTPFRTICGLRHEQWSFADRIETVAPCKRCFGSLSFKAVMERYKGVH
jgi:hypothetical protein